METNERARFPATITELRKGAGLKQREIAEYLGIKTNSYGNVEANNHKTMSIDRVRKLARFYQLDETRTADLIAAWEELPQSPFSQNMAPVYARRRETRAKLAEADRMRLALVEVASLALMESVHNPAAIPQRPGAHLCTCDPNGGTTDNPARSCELCNALQLLGMTGFTTYMDVIEKLAALQESMEPATK
jgi:transcriptional regulator with XRE-family HTH domain